MTTYRVGDAGATIFDSEGHAIATLEPGTVVVPGTIATDDSEAREHFRTESKRRGRYSDKRIAAERDYEDKER